MAKGENTRRDRLWHFLPLLSAAPLTQSTNKTNTCGDSRVGKRGGRGSEGSWMQITEEEARTQASRR